MDTIHQCLEIATFVFTLFGVPIAIYIYVKEQKLQREEREYGTYDALDDKYIEIQRLCLEYPYLDIFDTPLERQKDLTEEEQKQEEAILLIRISIFERAFLMYRRTSSTKRKAQWEGWETDMKEWLKRKNYKDVWNKNSKYYDKNFVDYLNNYLSGKEVKNRL